MSIQFLNIFYFGLDALAKLTAGKVYVGIRKGSSVSVKGVETVEVELIPILCNGCSRTKKRFATLSSI